MHLALGRRQQSSSAECSAPVNRRQVVVAQQSSHTSSCVPVTLATAQHACGQRVRLRRVRCVDPPHATARRHAAATDTTVAECWARVAIERTRKVGARAGGVRLQRRPDAVVDRPRCCFLLYCAKPCQTKAEPYCCTRERG